MIELSKLTEEINNRNNPLRDLPILGVNSSKKFMSSIANVIGADLSKYKLVKKGEFATNLMHIDRDETVPVSLLSNDACIVSPAYNVFKVKNTEICRAEYLNIVFKSKQFDRQAWFKSGSSIRGNLDWNKFLTLNINLPSIDKQCKLIVQYNTIEAKINILSKLNDNLLEQIRNIYNQIKSIPLIHLSDIPTLKEIKSGINKYEGQKQYFATGDIDFLLFP